MFEDSFTVTDGATYTALTASGLQPGTCPEAWIAAHPDALQKLQQAYLDAGCRFLCAPTAGINTLRLNRFGIAGSPDALCARMIALTCETAGRRAYVAAALAPTGLRCDAVGGDDPMEVLGLYTEQVRGIENAGGDLYFLQGMRYCCEAQQALEAIRTLSDRPVVVSFTPLAGAVTADGVPLSELSDALDGYGIEAIGVEDLADADENLACLRALRDGTDLPLLCRPSAGQPVPGPDGFSYPASPESLAALTASALELGVHLIGGGAGTVPAHIAAIRRAVQTF